MSDNEFGMTEARGKKDALVPCEAEDIDKIAKYNKDALRALAKKKFGYELDCGLNIAVLRDTLTKKVQIALGQIVEDPELDETTKKAIERVIPRFLLHPVNRRVNMVTPALLARGDMIPCLEDGTPINALEAVVKETNDEAVNSELGRLAQDLERQIS